MPVNLVNVVVSADSSPADQTPSGNEPAQGYVVAVPDGTQYPDNSGEPIVPMVQHGTIGDGLNGATAGECIVQLCASDNYGTGVLNWDFIINIRGFPTVKALEVPVNFSSGATQSVWAILTAAGWSPA